MDRCNIGVPTVHVDTIGENFTFIPKRTVLDYILFDTQGTQLVNLQCTKYLRKIQCQLLQITYLFLQNLKSIVRLHVFQHSILESVQNLSSQTRSDMRKTLLNILPISPEIDKRKLL